MAFDFFNQGIKKQTGAEFTKEEDDFLNSKLAFLDPKKTSQIPIGTVIQLFNLTKINSAVIKKILQNCKVEGKKALTYDEMKKVFRGISLAQKGVEPSTINITANIKLLMPKFYDDDDDEQEEQEPVKPAPAKEIRPPPAQTQPQAPPKPPANNTQKQTSFAEFGQFVQPQKPPLQQAPKQEQAPVQQPQPQRQIQQEPQDTQNNKIKQFEAYWNRLNTKNNRIDGGQVKTLCKNLAQRSNLSKAWKLCCHTHSGSLTKGQFYVFLQLVGSHNQLPDALTEEMKTIISKIDKANQNIKEKQKDRTVSQFSQLGSTQIFDNFGKSQLSITAPPPIPQRPTNQPPSVKPVTTQLVTQTASRLSGKLEAAQKLLQSSQQANEQQLLQFRRQQETMNNMMGEVQQFLLQVNNKGNKMRAEIDQLKNNQTLLNERFNKVCMGMNQVIMRQNAMIDELANELAQQNRVNEQKATVLQKYVADREAHCVHMEESQNFQNSRKTEHLVNSRKDELQVESENRREEHQAHQEQPQKEHAYAFQQRQPSPQPEHVASPRGVRPSPQPQQTVEHHQQPQHKKQEKEEQLNKQQQQYMNRMRMKQMQVIQLIHYLTPISQEEYPKIAQKITAYSEDQLNFAYSGLYEKLLEKQRLQQQQHENVEKSEKGRSSLQGEDEFNTSNFKNGEKQAPADGEDFFS